MPHTFRSTLSTVTLSFLILSWCAASPKLPSLYSPNGKLEVVISNANGTASFSVLHEGKVIIEDSPLGIVLASENLNFEKKIHYRNHETNTIDERYQMPTGKSSQRHNHGNEIRYKFENETKNLCSISFRAYNNGIAYRYFVENAELSEVINEKSGYKINELKNCWSIPFSSGDERIFTKSTIEEGLPTGPFSFPVLAESKNGNWFLFTEADVSNYPLSSGVLNAHQLNYTFARAKEGANRVSKNFVSPWRLMMFGAGLNAIVENNLVDHLAPPASGDYDWVKAGATSFPWWGENLANSSPEVLKKYIDLSAEMNWPYIEFDIALIDSPARAVENWKTTPWIKDIVKYGRERGVGCYGWDELSNLNTPEKRADIFSRYKELGIVGCKVDFVNSYSQRTRKLLEDLIKDAEKHQLLISFHGAQSPRGFARTYPHVVTFEAALGSEHYLPINKSKDIPPSHNCILPFTRNVLGSMDCTPVAFSSEIRNTTMAHELALSVVFESGWQGLCDTPESYLNSIAKPFLTDLPAAWDETRLLNGYPGEYCVIARRKGKTWYVGGINANQVRTLTINLSTIVNDHSTTTLYTDLSGEKDQLTSQQVLIAPDQPIEIPLKKSGGFAFKFSVR